MKFEKNILIAFILNFLFAIFEFIGGMFTKSIAIVSDSIHDMGDALSIGIAYFFEKKSTSLPDEKYTYGYVRYSVIGSLITTCILLVSSFFIINSSIKRIFNPVEINYNGMIFLSLIEVTVNCIAVYYTKDGNSLNQRTVNLHMFEDVLNWAVVLIGAIIMKFTDIIFLDSVLSILVALFIFYNALKNLKSIINLFLEKIPNGISVEEIKNNILNIKGINDVHHIHIWSIDGFNNYATMHIVVKRNNKNIKLLVRDELKKFGIIHATLELENENEICDSFHCNNNDQKEYKNHKH